MALRSSGQALQPAGSRIRPPLGMAATARQPAPEGLAEGGPRHPARRGLHIADSARNAGIDAAAPSLPTRGGRPRPSREAAIGLWDSAQPHFGQLSSSRGAVMAG